mgnify:CR=1 FL=1
MELNLFLLPITKDLGEQAVGNVPKSDSHRTLYPNTIRSIGLSPEKIVGQFIDTELAWNCINRGFKGESLNDVVLKFTLDNDIGKTYELNVPEIVDLLKENKWSISGYGTILDQGNGIGILPSVLGYWFKGRKELQAEKKKYSKLADQAKRDGDINKYEEYHKLSEYYDMLQGVRKVLLNSTYGALLNAYMRFGDPRLGASTTYTGRQISTHMINTISSILTSDDNYNKIQKRIVETKKNKRTGEVEINIENEYIDLQWYQRSSDLFLGAPANVLNYSILLSILGRILNKTPRYLSMSIGDAHIYNNHISQVKELLLRKPYSTENTTLQINPKLKTLEDFENATIDDFIIVNYRHHPALKAPMAV